MILISLPRGVLIMGWCGNITKVWCHALGMTKFIKLFIMLKLSNCQNIHKDLIIILDASN